MTLAEGTGKIGSGWIVLICLVSFFVLVGLLAFMYYKTKKGSRDQEAHERDLEYNARAMNQPVPQSAAQPAAGAQPTSGAQPVA